MTDPQDADDISTNDLLTELLDRLPGLEDIETANEALREKVEGLEEETQDLRNDLRQAETERDEAQEEVEKLKGDHPLREPDLMDIMGIAHRADPRATEYLLRRLGWHEVVSCLAGEAMARRAANGQQS